MYIYYPSCKFTATNPTASEKIKAYLATRSDMVVAGCCRKNQHLLTEADTAITICLSCAAITDEVSPHAGEISIWEYLLEDDSFPWPDYGGEEMTIQDCWRARHKPALQNAVRECMKRMNIVPVELAESFEKTEFDGIWRFNPVAQANLSIAPEFFGQVQEQGLIPVPREEQPERMKEWCKQYTTEKVVTYCNACQKGVQMGGVEGFHLMELMVKNL